MTDQERILRTWIMPQPMLEVDIVRDWERLQKVMPKVYAGDPLEHLASLEEQGEIRRDGLAWTFVKVVGQRGLFA